MYDYKTDNNSWNKIEKIFKGYISTSYRDNK